MADITKAKEVVKEALVGTEADVQLSAHAKATFDKNARKDETTGDLFLGEEEFIDAVAPPTEDYVSQISCSCSTAYIEQLTNKTWTYTAQDQARAICHSLQGGG